MKSESEINQFDQCKIIVEINKVADSEINQFNLKI